MPQLAKTRVSNPKSAVRTPRLAAVLLCLTVAFGVVAEDVRSVSQAAYAAYQAKDWAAYLENAKKLDAMRPEHPRVLYNLSGAYALAGETDLALATLERVAKTGLVYPAAKDDDFASIREDERFAKILLRFEENGRETGSATVAFTLEGVKGAVPEGVARDPKTGRAWVGLVRDRAILGVEPGGEVKKIPLPADVWSVTGITYDATTDTLWFATAATPMMRVADEKAAGRSAIVAIDAQTSKVRGRWELDNTDAPHWLGDLVLASDGTVYATDSRTPAIYRIVKDGKSIEKWVTSDAFASLQGLALSGDGKRLFVADYARGVFSVDVATGAASLLPVAPGNIVLGIDGLYVHDGDLVAIQNGTNPHRIIRAHLDAAGTKIERVETLEANRPQFDEPTLGTIQDGWLWFVATSQWGSFTDDGKLKEGAVEKPALVMKRKL